MAGAGLPIFILPVPLIGISTPVYPLAGSLVAAAEILGVWTAVKALNPDCPVEARCVSGVLNPATGAASFAAPETVLADLAVAQLFRERYGVPCGTGVGLIDAPVPGALSLYERTFKALGCALAGEPAFPVGIIGGLHLDSEHTARHFRDCLQLPKVLPRLKSTDAAAAPDPVELARRRYLEILEANPLREIGADRSRAVEGVLRKARQDLAGIRGATE